jgi:hypothetical protein
VKTFLREYKPPKIKIRFDLRNFSDSIHALIRSVFRLGIVGKERVQYWKLFLWTLVRKPRSFPMAITLAIYGHHFRKTSESRVQ